MVQSIRNEYLCMVTDFGLQQGRMFCISEKLNGQTLAEALNSKIADGAVLTEPLVRKIAVELLYALEEAGNLGLTHCNITPSNVFLSSDGVRLLGLGLSGWEPDVITNANYRLPVKAMPQYMSPEQVCLCIYLRMYVCTYALYTQTGTSNVYM
jgi:serine/threonine protein kinase